MNSIPPAIHFAMIAFVGGAVLGTVLIGGWSRKKGWLLPFSHGTAVAMLGVWIIYNAYYFTPGVFTWHTSLPLHVCDLLAPVAAWALIRSGRKARAILYFAAVALAGQAVITPTGDQSPTSLRFWLYWILHAGILACCALDLIVRGFRPTWRDYVSTALIELGYVAVVFSINVAFGWNYGYIGNSKPDTPTLIDSLGPWPERVLLIVLVGLAAQGAMLLPWSIARRCARK